MKIKIIHPTRGRKQKALSTAHKWMTNADNAANIQYVFSTDIDDTEEWVNLIQFAPDWFHNDRMQAWVIKNKNKSAIEAINTAASLINLAADKDEELLFIIVSDDTDCRKSWDTMLLNSIGNQSDFCAKTNDGIQPTLITMPVIDRVYYERYGYVYQPDYVHMFADQELTAVAMMTGKYIKLDLNFPHLHYTVGGMDYDAINAKNDATWAQGQNLFNERLKTNFGIENPVMKYEEILWR
jgi:hypothetical protein